MIIIEVLAMPRASGKTTMEKWDVKGGTENMEDKVFNNYWDTMKLIGDIVSTTTTDVLNKTINDGNIKNINVIVPNKVVEIEFDDGKEKMVCHKDDVFDLRRCCFIAIAKHLYKKEYTQEGIEYMATQLTYQKKYVKIVDKALKEYNKKMKEEEKRIRKEEEEKLIYERQSAKRRKQKERREKRHRDALVNMISDAINQSNLFD